MWKEKGDASHQSLSKSTLDGDTTQLGGLLPICWSQHGMWPRPERTLFWTFQMNHNDSELDEVNNFCLQLL